MGRGGVGRKREKMAGGASRMEPDGRCVRRSGRGPENADEVFDSWIKIRSCRRAAMYLKGSVDRFSF